MESDLQFFFGGTSRPIMIKLTSEFTLFSAEFGDCTGLQLMRNDMDAHAGLNLRTPREVCGLTRWLRSLPHPVIEDKAWLKVLFCAPGFSPEFKEESIPADGAFQGYDATDLNLDAVWRRDDEGEGLCLHIAASDEDGLGVQGVPAHLLSALCDALEIFAREWKADRVDLTLDQPLAHIPAP